MEQDHGGGTAASSIVPEDVRSTVEDAAENIKDQARDTAEQAKTQGVKQLSGVTRAVHNAADALGRELPQAANYIHSAADQLEKASSALRNRSIEDLADDFSNFTRRQPAAAFAGAVLAGFALSRFFKSSAPHRG